MRYGRRLIFIVLWLAVFDLFVPAVQRTVEHDRYEGDEVYRFENSDLFALGPLVSYLREQPSGGKRPRVAFLGNSVIWGYGVPTPSSVPSQFQEVEPGPNAFNIAINGFEMGSTYLVSKAIINSIDSFYVQFTSNGAHPILPSLIPVDDEDLEPIGRRSFRLRQPDGLERGLQDVVSHWRLYGATFRLQAAVLGSSTRQYVYLHKADIVRNLLSPLFRRPTPPPVVEPDGRVDVTGPRATASPSDERRNELRERYPVLWKFEELIHAHQKRAVFLDFPEEPNLPDGDIADLNEVFAPFGEVVRVSFPTTLTFDGLHLTHTGSQRLAEALRRRENGTSAGPQ